MSWRFSASQVSTYEDCPRKWGWKYIDGVFVEPHPSAQFGTEVHTHLEQWLRARVVPPNTSEGKVAQAMIPYLPAPQLVQSEYVERKFNVKLGGHSFIGYVDLTVVERGPGQPPLINDHKTTGDLKWALTTEELASDVQATLYSYWGFLHTKVDEVLLQWLYGRTKGTPLVLPVQRVVTKSDIEPRLKKTIESANAMALIKSSVKSARELPYDASACEKYGGCPFMEKCGLNAKERMHSIMSQGETAGFLAKLRKKKNEQQAQESAPSDAADAEAPKAETKQAAKQEAEAPKAEVNPPEQHQEAPKEEAKSESNGRSATASKRGRPKGSKNKKSASTADTQAASEVSSGWQATASSGWTLYIDCQPVRLPEGAASLDNAEDILSSLSAKPSGDEVREFLKQNPPAEGVILTSGAVKPQHLFAFTQEAESIIQG